MPHQKVKSHLFLSFSS
jgi:hypothetical protein